MSVMESIQRLRGRMIPWIRSRPRLGGIREGLIPWIRSRPRVVER
jgi:hypothetical protein